MDACFRMSQKTPHPDAGMRPDKLHSGNPDSGKPDSGNPDSGSSDSDNLLPGKNPSMRMPSDFDVSDKRWVFEGFDGCMMSPPLLSPCSRIVMTTIPVDQKRPSAGMPD
jgi:hypothetical protein